MYDIDYVKEHINEMEHSLSLINSQEQRIKELTNDVEDWKALAEQYHSQLVACNKEKTRLAEEISDLKAIAEQYQKQFEDCYEEKAKLTEENEKLRSIIDEYRKNSKECLEKLKKIVSEAKKFKNNILLTLFNELNAELLKVARCQKADEPNMRSQDVFDILDRTVKGMLEDSNER